MGSMPEIAPFGQPIDGTTPPFGLVTTGSLPALAEENRNWLSGSRAAERGRQRGCQTRGARAALGTCFAHHIE